MHAHGRFEQEAWTYDPDTLSIYRSFVLLDEQLTPYIRAAAATAARSGLPIIRPLSLIDHTDPRGWSVADAYGYGPSLWVAPVVEANVSEREVPLPRGRWIDFWTGAAIDGGRTIRWATPLHRIPVFVSDGAAIPMYPRGHVADGLGDLPEHERPLELTLWGVPREHRTVMKLADGTRVIWSANEIAARPSRELAVRSMDSGW